MDINLLSQNLVIILSMLIAGVGVFLVTKTYKKPKKKLRNRYYYKAVILVAVSLILAGILEFVVHFFFPSDKLPELLWMMILPTTLGLALVVWVWPSRRRFRYAAIINALACLIYSLVLINSYYGFYPTFLSVFSSDARRLALALDQSSTIQYRLNKSSENTNNIEAKFFGDTTNTVGRMESLKIPGTISGFTPRGELVYIPAIYGAQNAKLPVLVLVPGVPGVPGNWLGAGIKPIMDSFAKAHHGITPIVFILDNTGGLTNDTECVNSPRGNVETYLTKDVPDYIKANYKVDDNSTGWGIGGLSMGGMCSAMLALRHPDTYRYFVDLGGEAGPEIGSYQKTLKELFGGNKAQYQSHQILTLLKKNKFPTMGGYFAVGEQDKDSLINGMQQIYAASQQAGIEAIYQKFNGEHTWKFWGKSFEAALPWLSNRLGATECGTYCSI